MSLGLLLPKNLVSCHTHAQPSSPPSHWHSPPPPCLTSSQSTPGRSCPLPKSTTTLRACPPGANCVPASLCPMVVISIIIIIIIIKHIFKRNYHCLLDYKVTKCLARYSPCTTTTKQPTNRAPNEPAKNTTYTILYIQPKKQ